MKKEFDSVKSMREIREKLHKEYSRDPNLRKQRLKKIHSEYGMCNQNSDKQKVSEEIKREQYQTNKSIDSVELIYEVKEKIAKETAGMSFDELKEYFSKQLKKNKPDKKKSKSNKKN